MGRMTVDSPEFELAWDTFSDRYNDLTEKLEAAEIPVAELRDLLTASANLNDAKRQAGVTCDFP